MASILWVDSNIGCFANFLYKQKHFVRYTGDLNECGLRYIIGRGNILNGEVGL